MVVKEYQSPFGRLYLASIGNELCICSWNGLRSFRDVIGRQESESDYQREWGVIEHARQELEEYFDGSREQFDIPLRILGTEFQKLVWHALMSIPYGDTETYSELAESIGRPRSVMAVAKACSRNPLAIFIPCHRVTKADGRPAERSGNCAVKERLLHLERAGVAEMEAV